MTTVYGQQIASSPIPEGTRRAGSTEGAICSQTLARDSSPEKSYFSKNDFLRLFKTLLRPLLPPKHPLKKQLARLAQKTSSFQQIVVAKALRKSNILLSQGMTRFSDAGWEYDIPNGRNDQLLVQNGGPTSIPKVRKN